MLEKWLKDFNHAARSLARAPGFTAIVVATLALACVAALLALLAGAQLANEATCLGGCNNRIRGAGHR